MLAKGAKVRKDILIQSSVGAIILVAIIHALHGRLHEWAHAGAPSNSSAPLPVPNYIHFLLLNDGTVTFTHFLCILAALKHQRPEAMFFHVDASWPNGPYWGRLVRMAPFRRVAHVRRVVIPEAIAETPLAESARQFYAIGILKILLLRSCGGIYLDTNTFTARDLTEFRAADITLDSGRGMSLGAQISLARRDAPFLKVWSKLYRGVYDSNGWYLWSRNPIDLILSHHPELVRYLPEVGDLSSYISNSNGSRALSWTRSPVLRLPRDLRHPPTEEEAAPFDFHVSEETVRQYSMPLSRIIEEVAAFAENITDVR